MVLPLVADDAELAVAVANVGIRCATSSRWRKGATSAPSSAPRSRPVAVAAAAFESHFSIRSAMPERPLAGVLRPQGSSRGGNPSLASSASLLSRGGRWHPHLILLLRGEVEARQLGISPIAGINSQSDAAAGARLRGHSAASDSIWRSPTTRRVRVTERGNGAARQQKRIANGIGQPDRWLNPPRSCDGRSLRHQLLEPDARPPPRRATRTTMSVRTGRQRAQREAHAELRAPPGDRVRHDAVETDRGEQRAAARNAVARHPS